LTKINIIFCVFEHANAINLQISIVWFKWNLSFSYE
jgi:hypothetical protein